MSDPQKADGVQPEKWFLGLKVVLVKKGNPNLGFLFSVRGTAGSVQPPPVDMNSDFGCLMSLYHLSGLRNVKVSHSLTFISSPNRKEKFRVEQVEKPGGLLFVDIRNPMPRSEVLSAAYRPRGLTCKMRCKLPRPCAGSRASSQA